MPGHPFDSFAQNGEDVVLWRALGSLAAGRYVDVGANDPAVDSITRAFYDRGWRGITVEPMPSYAQRHRAERPEDLLVQAAITAEGTGTVVLHEITGTGLSTLVDDISSRHAEQGFEVHDIEVPARSLNDILEEAGWAGQDIHLMTVDVEGAELEIVRSIDLSRWRPWVLVIEATLPQTTQASHQAWEPLVLDAGYEFCLFDGLSRFYVAKEHAEDLAPALSYPTTPLDSYTTIASRRAAAELEQERAEVARLNELSHQHYARLTEADEQLAELRDEHHKTVELIRTMENSLSWRVTRPLRELRAYMDRRRARRAS